MFFNPGEDKAAYLAGEPAGDDNFVDSFAHVLQEVGGYSEDEAR